VCAIAILAALPLTAAPKAIMDIGPKFFGPTEEVVTPHIAWAKPYSKGKTRALFIVLRSKMREVVEIAQRMDLNYTVYSVNGIESAHDYFCGNDLEQGAGTKIKGTTHEEELVRLRRILSSDYDVFVIDSLHWKVLPTFAQYRMLEQVKAGSGIVKADLSCAGGRQDGTLTLAAKNRIGVPPQLAAGVPWQSLPVFSSYTDTAHFLDSTLSVSEFGDGRIVIVRGYETPFLQFLAPGFTVEPIDRFDKNRPFEHEKTKSEFSMNMAEVKRLDYDYYLAYVIKLVLYAAGKSPDIVVAEDGVVERVDQAGLDHIRFALQNGTGGGGEAVVDAEFVLRDRDNRVCHTGMQHDLTVTEEGHTVTFEVGPLPAGRYFADLWLRENGEVVAFGSRGLEVTADTRLGDIVLDQTHFGTRDSVRGTVGIVPGDVDLANLSLVFRQKDNLGRVVRRTEIKTVDAAEVPFNIEQADHPMTVYQHLEVELYAKGRLCERRQTHYSLHGFDPEADVRLVAWQDPFTSYVSLLLHDRLYDAGFDSTHVGVSGDGVERYYHGMDQIYNSKQQGRIEVALLSNLRNITTLTAFRDASEGGEYEDYVEGVRLPCLQDPEYRRRLGERAINMAKALEPLSVYEYVISDDSAFMHTGRESWELCYGPHCVAFFQGYLERTYGSIDKLNAEYGSDYEGFSDVQPVKMAEAMEDPKLVPLWCDFRMAMQENHMGAFALCREALRSVVPAIRFGSEGTFRQAYTYRAVDFLRAGRFRDITIPYGYLVGCTATRDFAPPDALVSLIGWNGSYPPHYSREFHTMAPWDNLFRGGRVLGHWFNLGAGANRGVMASDLSFNDYAEPSVEQMREIKRGIGKLLLDAEPMNGDVALLLSMPGTHLATLLDGNFRGAVMPHVCTAFMALMDDCGQELHFVAPEQIVRGDLETTGVKVVLLPYAQALSVKEIDRIKKFVAGGGHVIADLRPGVADEHCKPYGKSPIDELFGVAQSSPGALQDSVVSLPLEQGQADGFVTKADVDTSLQLDGGTPLGLVDDTPVVIENTFGKGKAVLLNFGVKNYISVGTFKRSGGTKARLLKDEEQRTDILFRGLLASMGLTPRVTLGPEPGSMSTYGFRSGNLEYVGLLQKLPEDLYAYVGGTAKLLAARKTTMALKREGHVYNIRTGTYVGLTDAIPTYITPGIAQAYALLPYKVQKVTVAAPGEVKQGDAVEYAVTITASSKPEKHVLHVSVTGPDGEELAYYTKNVDCVGGKYKGTWGLALNEEPGRYVLRARDVATGMAAEKEITVAGGNG